MSVRLLKIIGAAALGLVLAVAAGWAWGASGRVELQSRLDEMEMRHHVSETRARLLAARIDLYSLNFGAATGNLEAAKVSLDAVLARYDRDGDTARATELRRALADVEEARRLAAQVDQGAQAAAARALAALDRATSGAGR